MLDRSTADYSLMLTQLMCARLIITNFVFIHVLNLIFHPRFINESPATQRETGLELMDGNDVVSELIPEGVSWSLTASLLLLSR